MPTPYLDQLISTGELKLPAKVTVEDFKMLYALTLEARGFSATNDDVPKDQEKLVLVVLCRIDLPGKAPDFKNGMCATLSNYHGVARSKTLQAHFREKLSPRLIRAKLIDDIPLVSIRSIFSHGKRRARTVDLGSSPADQRR